MTQQATVSSVLGVAWVMLSIVSSLACEIRVRDAAFRTQRDVHRLCIIAQAGDELAKTITDKLAAWLDGPGKGLNLELVRVEADDPKVEWSNYGIPSAPPSLPVVVLVGKDYGVGESFVIDHWEPGPRSEDLAALETSPVRGQLQQELGRRLAVLLYAPAQGLDSSTAKAVLDEAVSKWSGAEGLGISVVQFDRTDHRERMLLSFSGIEGAGPDWVGVAFGRGKLMTPPLIGNEISGERLGELIEQLVQECSCSKPLPSIGVDLLMVWHDELDASVVSMNPVAALSNSEKEAVDSDFQDAVLETRLDSDATGRGPFMLTTTMWTLSAISLAVFAISAAIFWRGKRSEI